MTLTAMRKRSAALLEKEAADQDMGDEEEAEEEEEEDIAPSHMRRANKRHRGNTRHDSSDAESCQIVSPVEAYCINHQLANLISLPLN